MAIKLSAFKFEAGVGTQVARVTGSKIILYSVNQPSNIGIRYKGSFINETFTDSVNVSQSTLFENCIFENDPTFTIIQTNNLRTTVNFKNCSFSSNITFNLGELTQLFFTADGYSRLTGDGVQSIYFRSDATQNVPSIIFDTFFIVNTIETVNIYYDTSFPFITDFQTLTFMKTDRTDSIPYTIHVSNDSLENPSTIMNLPSLNNKYSVNKI